MRFVEERSTKEIAKALSLKETTVDVRIHRGRALLIRKLREEGYIKWRKEKKILLLKGFYWKLFRRDFSEELSNNKEVSVSPRFKRQMMAMMNNPNKWAERHKRDYRRRFVKVVATIVLTCSLPFGVLTVASPTVRAAVIDWVVEWYESSIIYKFLESRILQTALIWSDRSPIWLYQDRNTTRAP